MLLALALSSCISTRYLKDDEYLLKNHSVEFQSEKKKIQGAIGDSDVLGLAYQKPNKKFLFPGFSPYVFFYQTGLNHYDTLKFIKKREKLTLKYDNAIAKNFNKEKKSKRLLKKKNKKLADIDKKLKDGNFFMSIGEPLAILDSSKINRSKKQMTLFLNTNGYFNADVSHEIINEGKASEILYRIKEGTAYTIDSLVYNAQDSSIMNLVNESLKKALLRKGQRYDQDILVMERNRVYNLLLDNGYYGLNKDYIYFMVDTTLNDNKAFIELHISNPNDTEEHKRYKVSKVNFVTDIHKNYTGLPRSEESYDGVTFKYYSDEFSKPILRDRTFLKAGKYYSRSNTLQTQRQLSNLDAFKFININYDTLGNQLVANIHTSPLEKYQLSSEVGLEMTETLPGPFVNFGLRNRNIFKGFEWLDLSLKWGFEGVVTTDASKLEQSRDLSVRAALVLPRFLLPANRLFKEEIGKYNPKTTLALGYSNSKHPSLYDRSTSSMSMDYSWQNLNNTQFRLGLANISYINSVLDADYESYLIEQIKKGDNSYYLYQPSIVTSTSFSSVFRFNLDPVKFTKGAYLKVFGELGGTVLNLFGKDFLENQNLQQYQFMKGVVDFRKYTSLSENTTLAARVNIGVAYPYGKDKLLPLDRYFILGGSNTMRAWRYGDVGPGSYTKPDSLSSEYIFSRGDIQLMGVLELRQHVFGRISFSLFSDIGNIWNFYEVEGMEGGDFKFDRFYKEFAVASGYYLSFDLTYITLNVGVGMKIYDPSRSSGNSWVINRLTGKDLIGMGSNSQAFFGIGYSF